MTDKCDKYESYFVFANDEDFKKHITECDDCKNEYMKQQKVSALVKEVKDVYLKKEKSKLPIKLAACFMTFMMIAGTIVPFSIENYKISQLKYSDNGYFYELGMPVDEYGLMEI